MAELILTEADKKAGTYLAWDNVSLGKAVKAVALSIGDKKGEKSLAYTACATMLACMAAERNEGTVFLELTGVKDGQKAVGDWQIIIRNTASKVVGRINYHEHPK